LRRLFDAVASELDARIGPDEEADSSASADPAVQLPVYLQLEWNPEGDPMSYYYCVETEETLWEAPTQQARFSDLPSLERDVCELGNKVRALARCDLPSSSPLASPPPAARGLAEAAVAAVRRGSAGEARSAPPSPGSPRQRGAQTDHQAARTRTRTRSDATRAGAHLPGQLPWRMVRFGSLMLISVWLIATFGATLGLYGVIVIKYRHPKSSELLPTRGLTPVVLADRWPHRFPRPLGLACSPASGPVALLAEKYAVHELQLDSGDFVVGGSALSPVLERCLSSAPGFRGRGLADVGLDCSGRGGAGGPCSAVLLGADGRQVLRCGLDLPAAEGAASSKLLGGPWQALAPSDGRVAWALGSDRVPTQLRPHGSPAGTLVPALDLLEGEAADIAALHVLGNHTLLGLESNGRLHAWPLRGGSVRSWSLPAVDGVSWTGLCATMDRLYLAGAGGHAGGEAGVWQTPLPAGLRHAEVPPAEPILTFGAWHVHLW